MSETKLYDVDRDKCLTSLQEDDTSVVPRIGEAILWLTETYKVKGGLHDFEDEVVVLDVEEVPETITLEGTMVFLHEPTSP